MGGLALALAVVLLAAPGPAAAALWTDSSLPTRIVRGPGFTTIHYASGAIRTFSAENGEAITKALAGVSSVYGQTAPPAGEFVLGSDWRARLIASNTDTAPATRRGFMSLAEQFGLRRGFSAFGPVDVLIGANLAVWGHDAGLIRDLIGWPARGSEPAGGGRSQVADLNLTPVDGDTVLFTDGGGLRTPHQDGYLINPHAGAPYYQSLAGSYQQDDLTGCQNAPFTTTPGMHYWGVPTIDGADLGGCVFGWGDHYHHTAGWMAADPVPADDPGGATGGQVGTEPTAPAAQSAGPFAAGRDAVLAGTAGHGDLTPDEGRAVQAVTHGMTDEGGTTNPSPLDAPPVTVPACTGQYAACASALDAAGFTHHSRVVESFTGADVTKPADAVLHTTPAGGDEAAVSTTIEVDTNPADDEMPRVVPPAGDHVPYSTWSTSITGAGLTPARVNLSDVTLDPTHGPSEVTTTQPAPGTRVHAGTVVTARVNPDDAPDPAGGSGADAAPAPAGIDLSPLTEQTPCTKFPFGVPCWIVGALGGFGGDGHCPSFDLPVTPFGGHPLHVDLCVIQPAVDVIRPVVLVAALLGLGWFFMGAAMGFGGKGGDD